MKLTGIFLLSTVLTSTIQGLPLDLDLKVATEDKRDLRDLCGRWFCGHTRRAEISFVGQSETLISVSRQTTPTKVDEQAINEQSPTISDKRDLHDLCGRWMCGHTKKRSITLRNHLRSSIKMNIDHFSS
ncbi:hypothetical protein K7432_016716 [Basidiobolus ranarum]|uniref:Uncharacterized protein n=1 Tax=Basidiobolus ranarum TaxID=34480 RepID=A0ABR2VLA0_9FUNG